LLTEIHNTGHRMPAILREEDHEAWLSGSLNEARAALAPYPPELMLAWPVNPKVNSAKNDDESLLEPLAQREIWGGRRARRRGAALNRRAAQKEGRARSDTF